MALWDRVTQLMALEPWNHRPANIQERSGENSSIADLLARFNVRTSTWQPASIRDAMSVPAIFRSVAFISNTVGALSLEAWRKGVKLAPEDRPRLIVRPDPFQRPREFFRDTAYNMATRGEAWWWVARRDVDDTALSLLNIPPHEVNVTIDERDLRYPKIEWRGVRMPNEDMVQITYLREPGDLRGKGPLQMCGAAVSVTVEAQEWAAQFYADGGLPALIIKVAHTLGSLQNIDDPTDEEAAARSEAEALLAQWTNGANNGTRVIDPNIEEIKYLQPNEQGAQMLDARLFNVGEAVRMLGVPSSLLAYSTPGSSLTYQNVGQELDKFTRTCLWPDYLEGIEQAMSDLLTRSTTARFNVDALLRADLKTRYESHQIAISSGIYDAEFAATMEGFAAPGDVERAPVPFAPPQAIPGVLPIQDRSVADFRCSCGRKLAEEAGPGTRIRCRCGQVAEVPMLEQRAEPIQPAINVTFPPEFVRVDSPVTVHPPDVHVEPTFNAPEAAPLTVNVEAPGTEKAMAALGEQLSELGQSQATLAETIASLRERELARDEEQAEMRAAIERAAAPRTRRLADVERNEAGQIVAASMIEETAA